MNLRFLDTFLVIARLGSFRAAATELGLTQAAISGRIATLEADLGQTLFERTARDSRLTPAGQMLLMYAKQLLATESELRQVVAEQKPLGAETLKIGIKQELATVWLPTFLPFLASLHPLTQIQVSLGSTAFLHQQLQAGAVDMIVSFAALERQRGLRNMVVARLPMAWVALPPAQLPLAISLDEVVRQGALITTQPQSPLDLVLRSLLKKEKIQNGIVHQLVGRDAIEQFVRHKAGTAFVPRLWFTGAIQKKELCALPCLVEVEPIPVVCSWRSDSDSPHAHAFRATLKAFMRQQAADADGAIVLD
ncbi:MULTISPECIES: LysR family transcriptional regulator [Paenalcaligenes]|uniref:LysR family transcriptional regulator n=1 Tax=Paenalcaligenes hermetiae TaxID=1157987 RepID=A0ABP9MAF9_9BURK|nr:LysR family transcriptional regulator [Paenalcaligenes sp.]